MSPLILFKCLSEDTRLKIVMLLSQHTELCVCDLQVALEISQPKVSRHLAELRNCGLLEDERRGKWIYYHLHPGLPEWIMELVKLTADNNQDYLSECCTRMTPENPPKCER
ncbi:ArsR family transcriptional regulator [Alteromonas aestuariivivens]|uniref:ArsR family transcriptional regulator n=1 Tax=Alteromonas aestuariivivens TaxID=1938339 RepID=A0A3D8M3A2_9ALTE|nr:metalloregulator ArsR/SmtB family transcription factor [Alteromonas aestuariivivens]RDV24096.1 ArsR family transcriptional regulator [Alteromonas aestuariivivens]